MGVRRCAGILVLTVLLQGLAPAPATAEAGSDFELWLHRRNPDEPFRYYGFFEAVDKYYRVHALGESPDERDMTTVIRLMDVSERRDLLLAQIRTLKAKIARAPIEVAERDEHLAEMKAQKAAIEARVSGANDDFEVVVSKVEGRTIDETAQAWDDRMAQKLVGNKLERRLLVIDDEIARTEMGRIKAMQTGAFVDELIVKQEALKGVATGEKVVGAPVDLFLVSHKPLMLVSLAGFLLLTGLAVGAGKWPGSILVGMIISAAMAMAAFVFVAVATGERWIPATGVVGSPRAFGVGLVALIAARGVAERVQRDLDPMFPLKVAVIAVALVELATPVWYMILVPEPLLDIFFFGAWAFAALVVLESTLNVALQVLAMSAATLVTVMVGALRPWLGVEGTLGTLAVGAVLGVALVASDKARGQHAPVSRERAAEAPPAEAQETW